MKKISQIKFSCHKRLTLFISASVLLVSLLTSVAQAGSLLDEMQVADTCGTDYADKLASCSVFTCSKPSPMAMMSGFPSEKELKKMPLAKQQKIRNYMAEAEKKLAAMSPEKIAAMKAKMVSILSINGFDDRGRCQTSTIAIPGQRMDCALDKPLLKQLVDYTRLSAGAEHIQIKSESHLVNGKMVTTQVDVIDGKAMSNPWKQALDKEQCQFLEKNSAGAWIALNENSVTTPLAKPATKIIASNSSTLFIIDASGSMWGQINGKAKITIAKEVMAKLVAELDDNNRIGLIAYGHRRKGDCNDVETLVPLAANNKSAVLKAVQGLNAKGKTPLTRSLNQALKILQREKQSATIILVSDGIESCGADPCETVQAAKKYGVKFVLHTVGFGLSKKD
ncbi:MAG TPA: VWA domain-containing protein, partial [Phycisphaerales bacterium]|nr:VWA domain-containing protein [Phycisphaerales bacterium]